MGLCSGCVRNGGINPMQFGCIDLPLPERVPSAADLAGLDRTQMSGDRMPPSLGLSEFQIRNELDTRNVSYQPL